MIKSLQEFISHRIFLKLVALFAAIIMWTMVMNEQNPVIENRYTIPLTVADSPEEYKVSVPESAVKLTVRGQRSLFVTMSERDFRAYLELSDIEEGVNKIKVSAVLPSGFDLVDIDKDFIEVTAEKIIKDRRAIQVLSTGKPAEGSTFKKLTQETSYAVVEGPRSMVEKVTQVVGHVSLEGNKETFHTTAPLKALKSDGEIVDEVNVIPSIIGVDVELTRGIMKKTVPVKPVYDMEIGNGVELGKVKVVPDKVEITGTIDVVSKVKEISTEQIPVKSLATLNELSVKLTPPQDVSAEQTVITVQLENAQNAQNGQKESAVENKVVEN